MIAERTLTWSIPFSSKTSIHDSSSKVPASATTSLFLLIASTANTLPKTRSLRVSITSPPSIIELISRPSSVPQSSSVTTKSCATSTKRRVKYPEFAVLSAVSAKPLRAPCVEIKYCRTSSPSLKLAVIGVSIMEPSGLAINPRIPASCLICAAEPRAPESAIIKIELPEASFFSFPSESK